MPLKYYVENVVLGHMPTFQIYENYYTIVYFTDYKDTIKYIRVF